MTDELDQYRIPMPGQPCECGAIVLAGEHPVRFATSDSCPKCGMAARWQRRAPIRYRATHVCGAAFDADTIQDAKARLAEHAEECPHTVLARMTTGDLGMEVELRTRQEWIEAGVMEP